MNILFAAIGFIALIGGIVAVHYVNSHTSLFKRLSSVALTMLGGISIWMVLAITAPVVSQSSNSVYAYGQRIVIAKVNYTTIRNCQLTKFTAILIHGNNQIEIPTEMATDGEENGVKFAYVEILNLVSFPVEEVYLESTHICPFGFEIKTQYPKMKMPDLFNYVASPEHTASMPASEPTKS